MLNPFGSRVFRIADTDFQSNCSIGTTLKIRGGGSTECVWTSLMDEINMEVVEIIDEFMKGALCTRSGVFPPFSASVYSRGQKCLIFSILSLAVVLSLLHLLFPRRRVAKKIIPSPVNIELISSTTTAGGPLTP